MLKYNVDLKPGGHDPEEIKAEGVGGADAVVIVSIMRDGRPPHSGPISYAVLTADSVGYEGGDVPEIPDTELFQALTMMAEKVGQSATVPAWQSAVARDLVAYVRDKVAFHSALTNSPFAGKT